MNIPRYIPYQVRNYPQRSWSDTIQHPVLFSAANAQPDDEKPPRPPDFYHLLEAQTPKIKEPSWLKRIGLIGLGGFGIVGSALVFPPFFVFFSAALISLHVVTLCTYGSWQDYKKYMTAPRPFRMTAEQAREDCLYGKALRRYNRRQKLRKIGRFFKSLFRQT